MAPEGEETDAGVEHCPYPAVSLYILRVLSKNGIVIAAESLAPE
jgi:hypothetical protein